MNAAIHIFRKDLQKFWPLIALAVAVHSLGYCVALSNLDAMRMFSGLDADLTKVFHQAPLVRWIVVFLLSVWVVLEDRGVGDRIAWMTRPIFAREILAAKFAFLVFAVAMPAALVGIGVALWLKASLAAVLAVGAVNLLFTLFGAAIFASIAVVCSTMNQALLLAAGSFGALALISYGVFQIGHVSLPPAKIGISPGTEFIAAIAMTSVSAVVALGHQYATRRAFRTKLLALMLGLATFVISHYSPVSLWPNWLAWATVTPTAPDKIKLIPGTSAADFNTSQRAFGEGVASLKVPIRLEGAPPDRLFVVQKVTSTLVMDDGQTIQSFQVAGNPSFEDGFAALFALGYSPPVRPTQRYIAAIACPVDVFGKLQGRSGRLAAQLDLAEEHYETIVRLPVRPGAKATEDGHLSRILSTQFTNGRCEVGFQFAQINPILGERRFIWPNKFVLVNSKREEYSESESGRVSRTGSFDMDLVTVHLQFGAPRNLRTAEWAGEMNLSWLNGADLIFLAAQPIKEVQSVSLSVTIDKLMIPMKQATQRVIVINPDGTRTEFER